MRQTKNKLGNLKNNSIIIFFIKYINNPKDNKKKIKLFKLKNLKK